MIEIAEKDDRIAGFSAELTTRDDQLRHMEEKNKQLTHECTILTNKILEERNKMIEIMNEANTVYEDANV